MFITTPITSYGISSLINWGCVVVISFSRPKWLSSTTQNCNFFPLIACHAKMCAPSIQCLLLYTSCVCDGPQHHKTHLFFKTLVTQSQHITKSGIAHNWGGKLIHKTTHSAARHFLCSHTPHSLGESCSQSLHSTTKRPYTPIHIDCSQTTISLSTHPGESERPKQ